MLRSPHIWSQLEGDLNYNTLAHTGIPVHACAYIRIYTCIYIYAYIYVYIYIYVCILVGICVCIYIHIYTYIYIHIYIYIHMYIHVYIYICGISHRIRLLLWLVAISTFGWIVKFLSRFHLGFRFSVHTEDKLICPGCVREMNHRCIERHVEVCVCVRKTYKKVAYERSSMCTYVYIYVLYIRLPVYKEYQELHWALQIIHIYTYYIHILYVHIHTTHFGLSRASGI